MHPKAHLMGPKGATSCLPGGSQTSRQMMGLQSPTESRLSQAICKSQDKSLCGLGFLAWLQLILDFTYTPSIKLILKICNQNSSMMEMSKDDEAIVYNSKRIGTVSLEGTTKLTKIG